MTASNHYIHAFSHAEAARTAGRAGKIHPAEGPVRFPGQDGRVAATEDSGPWARPSYGASLAGAALAYALLHHLGSLPQGLGNAPRGTRWVDWLDLFTPYLVLAAAGMAVRVAEAAEHTWWLFALGAVAYSSGHGIHLAANSVGNTAPGPTAHLWDEIVGHLLWYLGVALVVAALAETMVGRTRPRSLMPYALALAVGLTWASNALGGEGTVLPGLLLAVVAVAFGWPRRAGLPILLVVAGGVAAGVLAVSLVANLS